MNVKMFLSLLLLGAALQAVAQTQPKIMVIPYTKQGEDIRTVLEKDENKRIVLTKIKEAFDEQGFTTVDFVAKLKAIESGNVLTGGTQQDIKTAIIDYSGADIYVEAEIMCQQQHVTGQSNPESRVKIVVTGYEAATGNSLANKIGESGAFYTRDIGKLGMKAIKGIAGDFLRVLQQKFTAISENGQAVMIQVTLAADSKYTLESMVGTDGNILADEIELWVGEHAYQGDYHIQGSSALKMLFDDIKLPPMSENGKPYRLLNLKMDFTKFLRSLGISASSTQRGNTLYFTIQ